MRLVAPRPLAALVLLLLPLRVSAVVSFSTTELSEFIDISNPQAITLADVNGDNVDDLITVVADGDSVAVHLNDGDGEFDPAVEYDTVDSVPVAVVTGLFNDDNFPDIAVANNESGTVSVLLGIGGGEFDEDEDPFRVVVGDNPIGIGVGRINNDQEDDLLVLSPNLVYVLQGNGDGTFSAGNPATILTRSNTQTSFAIAVGLLDADTNLDYVVTNREEGQVVTFFGNGNGTFTLGQFIPAGDSPTGIIIADADGDTDNDLMAVDSGALPFDEVRLITNTGDPDDEFLFDPLIQSIVAGENPLAITGFDIEPDNMVDIAVTTVNPDQISVLCQPSEKCELVPNEPLEAGLFRQPRAGTILGCSEEGQVAIVSGKLNGDTMDDLVALSGDLETLCIIINTSRVGPDTTPGTVTATPTGPTPTPTETVPPSPTATPTEIPTVGLGVCNTKQTDGLPGVSLGRPVAVAVEDFNQDGDRDVAVADSTGNRIVILETNLQSTSMPMMACRALGLQVGTSVDVAAPEKLITADLDRDGTADLAVIGQQGLSVFYGDGAGGFSPSAANPMPAGTDPSALATADFNRDFTPDIVVSDLGSQNVSLFLGTRGQAQPFGGRCVMPVGRTTNLVVATDLNADARADFAVAGPIARDIGIFLQRQTAELNCASIGASFQGQDPPSIPNEPVGMVAGLFTLTDNIPDLVLTMRVSGGSGTVLLYEGRATDGNGVTYQSATAVTVPTPVGGSNALPTDIDSGDIERDGLIDLVVTDTQNNTLAEYRGQSSGGIGVALDPLPLGGVGPADLEVVDIDRDGRDDVVVANPGDGSVSYLLSNQRLATPTPANTPTATATMALPPTVTVSPTISPTTTRTRRPSPSQTPGPTNTQRGVVSLSDNGCAIDDGSSDFDTIVLAGFAFFAFMLRRRALALLGG